MLLEKDHVNQSICGTHLGLTYSLPPFSAAGASEHGLSHRTVGGRAFPAHSSIFRMSRFQNRPFLLAWPLVPYHRQCHGLRRWCAISSTWLDHGISCLFRGASAANPPNPAADRQTSLSISSHMCSQITPSHRQQSLRRASYFRSHLL